MTEQTEKLDIDELIIALQIDAQTSFDDIDVDSLSYQASEKLQALQGQVAELKKRNQILELKQEFGDELSFVTHEQYADAVIQLFDVARHDTGGGAAAAQVLLGLYNCHEWHVDLVDVACRFDAINRHAALVAILGRGQLMTEPHRVIEDGDEHFAKLWKQWEGMSIKRRYARHYEQYCKDGE